MRGALRHPPSPAMQSTADNLRAQQTLRDDLTDVLSPLRFQDVRDFLLGKDARVDASIVTASNLLSRSVAGSAKTASNPVGSTASDAEFGFNLEMDWLFIPAMAREAYTLGLLPVKDDARTSEGMFKPVMTGYHLRRFVRYCATVIRVRRVLRGRDRGRTPSES